MGHSVHVSQEEALASGGYNVKMVATIVLSLFLTSVA